MPTAADALELEPVIPIKELMVDTIHFRTGQGVTSSRSPTVSAQAEMEVRP
jgi:hypothetical protein